MRCLKEGSSKNELNFQRRSGKIVFDFKRFECEINLRITSIGSCKVANKI